MYVQGKLLNIEKMMKVVRRLDQKMNHLLRVVCGFLSEEKKINEVIMLIMELMELGSDRKSQIREIKYHMCLFGDISLLINNASEIISISSYTATQNQKSNE